MASRLITPLIQFKRLDEGRKTLIRAELTRLAKDINLTLGQLGNTIENLTGISNSVASAATELAAVAARAGAYCVTRISLARRATPSSMRSGVAWLKFNRSRPMPSAWLA